MKHLHQEGSTYTSVKAGGAQIEFEDENPDIHKDFEAAVAKAGALCQMGGYHPFCTQRANSSKSITR